MFEVIPVFVLLLHNTHKPSQLLHSQNKLHIVVAKVSTVASTRLGQENATRSSCHDTLLVERDRD